MRAVDHESLAFSLGESIENTPKFGNMNFEEIDHVRRLLEVPSAREAALRRTEADIETLRAIIDRQKEIALDDPGGSELDSAFHTAVAEASKNRVLASLVFALHSVIRWVLFLNISPEVAESTVRQHIAIARGIVAGDEEAAAKAMEEHLDYLDTLEVWREKSKDIPLAGAHEPARSAQLDPRARVSPDLWYLRRTRRGKRPSGVRPGYVRGNSGEGVSTGP